MKVCGGNPNLVKIGQICRYPSLNIHFYALLHNLEERPLARTGRIPSKFDIESFMKACGGNPNVVKIGQICLTIYLKT
jgi:hypothetical protein